MIGELLKSIDLVKWWKNTKKEDRERLAVYVSHIADSSEELALIWTRILVKLIDNYEVSLENDPLVVQLIEKPENWADSNAPVYSRIEKFRNRLHYIVTQYDPEKADLLFEKLSKLMVTRNLSREQLSQNLGVANFDKDEIFEMIKTINDQAAEIRIFALEIAADKHSLGAKLRMFDDY